MRQINRYGKKNKKFDKPSTFSSLAASEEQQAITKTKRKALLTPRIQRLSFLLLDLSLEEVLQEIENIRLLSNQICCPSKPSYTMEEAAVASQNKSPYLEPYLCRSCGFVHFGHIDGSSILDTFIQRKQLAVNA